MNYPLYIARRLSLGSGTRKSSPAVKVAAAAVALSLAVMIASIAIVIGFKREIKSKVLGFNSHITLYAMNDTENGETAVVNLTPSLSKLLSDLPFVTSFSLEASIPAILKTNSEFKGIYLKSLMSEEASAFIKDNLEEGAIPDFKDKKEELSILISRKAANELGLKTGDKINTYFLSGDIRVRPLVVKGIFNTHFDSYDDIFVYGSLGLIQNLGSISSSEGTALMINTDNFDNIEANTALLRETLEKGYTDELIYRRYRVENALGQGAAYFHWLALLDTNVAVIIALMTVVAIVTLISGMLIIILDKKRFIGLLRSMGATVRKTRSVFLFLALRVAVVGMLIGDVVIGILLWLQNKYHFIPLDPDSYYIDFVPVELDWTMFALLNAGVLLIIYIALVLPSNFVAKISPSETMRNE